MEMKRLKQLYKEYVKANESFNKRYNSFSAPVSFEQWLKDRNQEVA